MSTTCARCGNEIDLTDLVRAEETIYRIEKYLEVLEFGALIGDDSTITVSEALPRVARKIRSFIQSSAQKVNEND